MKMKTNKTRNELKVSDSNTYRLKNEERTKNGGKSSQICSRKCLRSVAEALRLDFFPLLFMEALRKSRKPQKLFFNKTWRSLHPVASSLSNPTSKMFQKGLDLNCYLHPYIDKFTPIFVFLAVFFPKSLETLRIPPR